MKKNNIIEKNRVIQKAKELYKKNKSEINISVNIVVIAILIYSVIVRITQINFMSEDYNTFLMPWFNKLKVAGGLQGIKSYSGDYQAIYIVIMALLTYLPLYSLVSIKLVSISFDYISALFIFKILCSITKKNNVSKIIGALVTILPTVILNSSVWGQADSIYTAFILITIYMFMKDRENLAFVFYGLAFAFKLQAIFILPAIVIYYFSKRKLPLKLIITGIVAVLPNIIVYHNILGNYGMQVTEYVRYISMNIPNIYWLLKPNIISKYGCLTFYTNNNIIIITMTIVTLLIFFVIAISVWIKRSNISKEKLLDLSVISVIICVYFLPCMHDRYMYVADILSFALLGINIKKIYVFLCVNMLSLLTYIKYLTNAYSNTAVYTVISGVTLIVLVKLLVDFLKEIKNNREIEKKEEETFMLAEG